MYTTHSNHMVILILIILLNKAAYADIIQGEWTPSKLIRERERERENVSSDSELIILRGRLFHSFTIHEENFANNTYVSNGGVW